MRAMVRDGHSGIIESFGYPKPYATNQVCLWHIKVPPGYTIHIDFHDKFGIYCTSRDQLAISSLRLFINREPLSSSHTLILCGVEDIYNVTTPQRDMWICFRAHKNATGAIGFRLNYTAVDVDECEEKHICAHLCTNTIGSYKCSCQKGYKLAADGFNCMRRKKLNKCKRHKKCQPVCKNTLNDPKCSCPKGCTLEANGCNCTRLQV